MNNSTGVSTDNRFAIIPHWVILSGISDSAFRLYAVLMKYANNETGQAWPSRATLSADIKKSEKTVDRAIKELVEVNALKVTRRRREGTKENFSNLYTVITAHPNPPVIPEEIEVAHDPSEDDWIQDDWGTNMSPRPDMGVAVTKPKELHPISVTSSNKFDDQIKESGTGERVRPATKTSNPEGINSTGLTKKQRDPLRNQLVKIGHLMQAGASFQDDSVQDEWYDFGRMVEETFPDEFDTTGLADIIDNQKSSVDAKCVDPLVAGKRLTSIINTGLAN